MQSEMISKPCQRFASVCASIDTEVDRILDRLLRGSKPHAYLSSHFLLRSLIFKHNDTLCPCQSSYVLSVSPSLRKEMDPHGETEKISNPGMIRTNDLRT